MGDGRGNQIPPPLNCLYYCAFEPNTISLSKAT